MERRRWEKKDKEGRGEGACSQSFSPSLGAALRPLELSLEPSKRRAASSLSLSGCGGESPSVFIGRQHDGRRLPRMLTKEFSSSSSTPPLSQPPPPPSASSLPTVAAAAHPFAPSSFFSLPRTALKYSRFALLHSCGNSQPNPLRLCLERERERESVHIHTRLLT